MVGQIEGTELPVGTRSPLWADDTRERAAIAYFFMMGSQAAVSEQTMVIGYERAAIGLLAS